VSAGIPASFQTAQSTSKPSNAAKLAPKPYMQKNFKMNASSNSKDTLAILHHNSTDMNVGFKQDYNQLLSNKLYSKSNPN
jgi:hypothetical protein